MNRNDIIQLLKAGYPMHCQFVDDRRVFWMEVAGNHIAVPEQMGVELITGTDPAMAGAGDSLFGSQSTDQSFRIKEEGK